LLVANNEEVGRKPLSDGFVAVPVREFRGTVIRLFPEKELRSSVLLGFH
jgi:hypothetical protein